MSSDPTPRITALYAAHICALGAWLHHEDDEQINNAVIACQNINVDYCRAVTAVVISQGATLRTARRAVAESLRKGAENQYAKLMEDAIMAAPVIVNIPTEDTPDAS